MAGATILDRRDFRLRMPAAAALARNDPASETKTLDDLRAVYERLAMPLAPMDFERTVEVGEVVRAMPWLRQYYPDVFRALRGNALTGAQRRARQSPEQFGRLDFAGFARLCLETGVLGEEADRRRIVKSVDLCAPASLRPERSYLELACVDKPGKSVNTGLLGATCKVKKSASIPSLMPLPQGKQFTYLSDLSQKLPPDPIDGSLRAEDAKARAAAAFKEDLADFESRTRKDDALLMDLRSECRGLMAVPGTRFGGNAQKPMFRSVSVPGLIGQREKEGARRDSVMLRASGLLPAPGPQVADSCGYIRKEHNLVSWRIPGAKALLTVDLSDKEMRQAPASLASPSFEAQGTWWRLHFWPHGQPTRTYNVWQSRPQKRGWCTLGLYPREGGLRVSFRLFVGGPMAWRGCAISDPRVLYSDHIVKHPAQYFEPPRPRAWGLDDLEDDTLIVGAEFFEDLRRELGHLRTPAVQL